MLTARDPAMMPQGWDWHALNPSSLLYTTSAGQGTMTRCLVTDDGLPIVQP